MEADGPGQEVAQDPPKHFADRDAAQRLDKDPNGSMDCSTRALAKIRVPKSTVHPFF